MKSIRSIGIIAHVDHGKTTLVDELLKESGTFKSHQVLDERVMDSNDLEKERGITILSKNTAIFYNDHKINIVDTPGHADFGGEVERVLSMVDAVLLVVDAYEGPMPQTRYVLGKALKQGLQPIVVINKIDRENAEPTEALNKVFDLFIDLEANEEQLEFPVIYASAKKGFAVKELGDPRENMFPLLDSIIESVPPFIGEKDAPFQMLVSNIEGDNYLGTLAIGKIKRGIPKRNQQVIIASHSGEKKTKIGKILTTVGLERNEVEEGTTGDIVIIAGLSDINIGETICDADHVEALEFTAIDAPTVSMVFTVNDSPFAGLEGDYVTSRHIRNRLYKEAETNLSLKVEDTERAEAFKVSGRGELHLSILIENMRREGFELLVSKPKILFKEIDGVQMEPIEELIIDVPDEYVGTVMEKVGGRKGILSNMISNNKGFTRLKFTIPSRFLIGYRGEFLTETRGNGIMNHSFYGYDKKSGSTPKRNKGVIVAFEKGVTKDYGLFNAQDKGTLFVGSGTDVYEGMIIGEAARPEDLSINVCKEKHLSNMRSSGSDDTMKLSPPKILSLEESIDFIDDDELVEVTPENIRLRKKILDSNIRSKSQNRSKKNG